MSILRKIERNQAKQIWKNHNKDVPKKQRTEFSGFWKWLQKKKRGEE